MRSGVCALIVALIFCAVAPAQIGRDSVPTDHFSLSLPGEATVFDARIVDNHMEADGRRVVKFAIGDALSVVTVSPTGEMLAHIWTDSLKPFIVEVDGSHSRTSAVIDHDSPCHLASRLKGQASSVHKRRVVAAYPSVEIRVLLLRVTGEATDLTDSAVTLRFDHAIDLMNTALANSALGWIKFVAAGVERVEMPLDVEADASDGALYWISDPANIVVENLRRRYHADLVTLAAQRAPLDVTYARPFPGDAGPAYGFIVLRSLLSGADVSGGNNDYAMVALHEWGHALGGDHNPEDAVVNVENDPAPYARCFHGCGASVPWRGPLAYSAHCSPDGTCVPFCSTVPPRYPLFSNPSVIFRGAPAGVAERQDNARAFRQIAPLVAGYAE